MSVPPVATSCCPPRRRRNPRFRKTHFSANRPPFKRRSRLAANRRVVLLGPFGEPLIPPTGVGLELPFRFSTKYYDVETGLYSYIFRPYDPITGRWLSRDPIGEKGGVNIMSFVENVPSDRFDPIGKKPFSIGNVRQGHIYYSCYCGWLDKAHFEFGRDIARQVFQMLTSAAEGTPPEPFRHNKFSMLPIFPKPPTPANGAATDIFTVQLAFRIFKGISTGYEASQSVNRNVTLPGWLAPHANIPKIKIGSGYSVEDLPSNVVGFLTYVHELTNGAHGLSKAEIDSICGTRLDWKGASWIIANSTNSPTTNGNFTPKRWEFPLGKDCPCGPDLSGENASQKLKVADSIFIKYDDTSVNWKQHFSFK